MFAGGGYSGLRLSGRTPGRIPTYPTTTAPTVPGTTANCTGANVTMLGSINGSPAGKVVNVSWRHRDGPPGRHRVLPLPPGTVRVQGLDHLARPHGALAHAGQRPARPKSWPAPFATTARVNFYVNNVATAQAAVPTLSTIRGFELVLNGESERTPYGNSAPKTTLLTTSVFFTNRPD